MLKRPEVTCEGNISGEVVRNFSTFLAFLERVFFRKSPVKPERCDRFQLEKILKIIEPIQSDRVKYHCLFTQGAVASQTLGVFLLTR